jgi:hypothetical protein
MEARPRSRGRLEPSPQLRGGDHAELLRSNRVAGLEIDAGTLLTGTGEKMDLGMAVDALLAIDDD